MNKIDFDYNQMYNRIYDILKEDYKGETEEFYKNKAKERVEMHERNIMKCNAHHKMLDLGYGDNVKYHIDYFDGIPRELFPNVYEWIDDKPLSDIKYNGLSFNMIIQQYYDAHDKKLNFVEAVLVMFFFVKNGCKNIQIAGDFYEHFGGVLVKKKEKPKKYKRKFAFWKCRE